MPLGTAFSLVVVAASLGGLDALGQMLEPIPRELPVPVLIVQHLARPSWLPELLERRTRLPIQWAASAQMLLPGQVYVAPPERHLVISGEGRARTHRGDRVNYACPAADPLFFSAARYYGARTLGVILSGRLHDGAAGADAVRRAGGTVIVQDAASCVAPSMPAAAVRGGQARLALPPESIGHAIVSLTMMPGASALFGIQALAS